MLVYFALGKAKVLSFALGDAKTPNANCFALQWNIGFIVCQPVVTFYCKRAMMLQ